MSENKQKKWLLILILMAGFFFTAACGAASTVSAQPALQHPSDFLINASDLSQKSEDVFENVETYLDSSGFHVKSDFDMSIDQQTIWVANHITFQDHPFEPVYLLLEPDRFESIGVTAFDQLEGIGDEAIYYQGEMIELENHPEAHGRGSILRFYKGNVFVEVTLVGNDNLSLITDLAIKLAKRIPETLISLPEIQGIGEKIDQAIFEEYFESIQLSNGITELNKSTEKNICIEVATKTPDQIISTAIFTDEQELVTKKENYILPYKLTGESSSHIQRDCDLQRLDTGNYIYKVWAFEKLVAILPFTVR